MSNDKNIHTDEDFDDFIKAKVDQAEHTDPNDFDVFYQKLESTGFSTVKKTGGPTWMIVPALLVVGAGVLYLLSSRKETTTNESKNDLNVQQNATIVSLDSSAEKTDESILPQEKNTVNINAANSIKTSTSASSESNVVTEGSATAKTQPPLVNDNVKRDSSTIQLPEQKIVVRKDSVRIRYQEVVDTIIQIDSQRVSKRKWNKNKK